MTIIRQWLKKYMNKPGYEQRRIYINIREQMKNDKKTFAAKWWDTEIAESKWKEMLKEALE